MELCYWRNANVTLDIVCRDTTPVSGNNIALEYDRELNSTSNGKTFVAIGAILAEILILCQSCVTSSRVVKKNHGRESFFSIESRKKNIHELAPNVLYKSMTILPNVVRGMAYMGRGEKKK